MSSVSSVGSGSSIATWLAQLAQNISSTGAATSGASSSSIASGTSSTGSSAGHHHHGAISSQLQNAITSALSSASSSSDPNQVVQSAIQNFLSSNAQNTDGDNAATDASSPETQFEQLLKSKGIDPKQFKEDLKSAIENVGSGNIDFSKVFANFPPGSSIDTSA